MKKVLYIDGIVTIPKVKLGSVSIGILFWEPSGCNGSKYVHYVQDPWEGGGKHQQPTRQTLAQNQSI